MRSLKDWIKAYLEYTEDTESPTEFHLWSAIHFMGILTGRKIRFDRGFYKLFPNTYLMLVAKSALCRKSTSLDIIRSLCEKLDPPIHLTGDVMTAPALVRALYREEEPRIHIYASEMGTFLKDVFKTNLHPILTRLYDCPDVFDVSTIARGVENLEEVYITICGAVTPDDIAEVIPPERAGGGFPSRFIFVHKEEQRKRVPRPTKTPEARKLEKLLLNDAQHIRSLAGTFQFTPQAGAWYDAWYEQHCNRIEGKLHDLSSLATGYFGRKHDLLLKVAMCLSLAESDSFFLGIDTLETASNLLDENEVGQLETYKIIGATKMGILNKTVAKMIQRYKSIPHPKLMSALSYKMSGSELNTILETLLMAGLIDTRQVLSKGKPVRVYRWKGGERDEDEPIWRRHTKAKTRRV